MWKFIWSKNESFILEKRVTLKIAILGSNSIKHVHYISEGCSLKNVYYLEDVCVDALTLEGGKNTYNKFIVKEDAVKGARDIIIRHNSTGSLSINSFYAENSQRLYLSCPNCNAEYQRRFDVTMTDFAASNVKFLAAANKNYEDTITFKKSKITDGTSFYMYIGNNNGGDPKALGNQCETSNIYSCTCS